MLRSPVQEKCEEAGLAGCPDFAEGVVLYAAGDKQQGTVKLKAGVAANTGDDVRKFSKVVATVAKLPLPGVGQYAAPIGEIAELLATEADAAPATSSASLAIAAPQSQVSAKRAPPAEPVSNPYRGPPEPGEERGRKGSGSVLGYENLVTGSVSIWSQELAPCTVGGADASCARVQQGPLVVTDVSALRGCPDPLFLGGNMSIAHEERIGLRWMVEATHPGIHGARYLIRAGESLVVAVRPGVNVIENPGCMVTWAGYRLPR